MNPDLIFSNPVSWILTASLRASLAAGIILGLQFVLGRHLPARWRLALWVPFVWLLALPLVPDSPLNAGRWWRNASATAGVGLVQQTGPDAAQSAGADLTSPGVEGFSAQPAGAAIFWRYAAGWVWLAGFAGILLTGTLAYRREMRRIRRAARPVSPELMAEVRQAAGAAGWRSVPEVVCADSVAGPAVTGWLRPVLLLPAGFPGSLTVREAALVLHHECLHLRHRDGAWDVIFWVLNAAHWFNPVVWVAMGRLRADREMARDAEVLAEAGVADRSAYGDALLRLQLPQGTPLFRAGFVGLVNQGNRLRQRLSGLGRHRKIHPFWHPAGALLTGAVLLATGATAAPVSARSPAIPSSPATPAAPRPRAGDAAVAKAKSQILPEVRFQDATIQEVVDYVLKKTREMEPKEVGNGGFDVHLDLRQLKNPPMISLTLRDASAYDILGAAAEMSGLRIGPDPEENVILITALPATTIPLPATSGQPTAISGAASKIVLKRVAFKDAYIDEVVAYLSDKAKQADPALKGVIIEVAPGAGNQRAITMDLRDVPLLTVLNAAARSAECVVIDDGKMLKVVPKPVAAK